MTRKRQAPKATLTPPCQPSHRDQILADFATLRIP